MSAPRIIKFAQVYKQSPPTGKVFVDSQVGLHIRSCTNKPIVIWTKSNFVYTSPPTLYAVMLVCTWASEDRWCDVEVTLICHMQFSNVCSPPPDQPFFDALFCLGVPVV